jgi:predicted acetylornithine/succinylornithine family transaminase
VFVRGKGSWLWDERGRKYLDLFPGWGVAVLGHSHPRLARILGEQAKRLIHLPNNLYFKEQALLARDIVKGSFASKVFFANSGAEAVEGALKISRLFGNPGRYEIIAMNNSFHGRTFGALSATGQKKYKDPFRPVLAGFREAAFGDFASFKRCFNKKTVGVILELIQGEGGVNVADKGYVRKVKKFCSKHKLLFIVDEVQTGMGRTGTLFAFQQYGITPDIMVLSKGLGAGVPISAIVVNKRLADIIKPGMHASTFGGSPLVTRISREVLATIERENILGNVAKMHEFAFGRLQEFKKRFSFIKEVRGKGLMLGIELTIDSFPVFLRCLTKRLIVNSTHKNVLRIMPALNVKKEELARGLVILEDVFSRIKT